MNHKNPAPESVAFVYRLLDGDEHIDCVAFPQRWINNDDGRAIAAECIVYSNAGPHGDSGSLDSTYLRLTISKPLATWMKLAARDGVLHFPAFLAASPYLPKVPLVVTVNGVPV